MPKSAPLPRLLIASLIACYLIWGSTYLAIRFALESFPPFWGMGTRFLVAGGLLMGCMLWREGRAALPTPRQWLHALVIGAMMLGGGMGLTANAEVYVGSGLIATFIAVVPMMVSALGLLFGQRPNRLELLGMLVGLAGVLLLMRGASFSGEPLGILFIVGATLLWSLGSVLSTTRMPLAAGPSGFASEMLCGGVVLMLLSVLAGEPAPHWPPTAAAAFAWIYLVVFGSLIAFSAYLYLLAHASPALATSYAFVNPVIALLLGVWLGGEVVTRGEWLASGIILLGVVLIFRGRQVRPSRGPAADAGTARVPEPGRSA